MTHHTKPYLLIAMVADPPRPGHRQTGTQVLIGEYDTKAEQDRAYARERKRWLDGGYDSATKEILRGEVGRIPTGRREAEEADRMYQAFTQGVFNL